MDKDSLLVLDELNKGCSMGIESLEIIEEKATNKAFKRLIFNLIKKYEEMSTKINSLHEIETDEEAKDNSTMAKAMTWGGIQMRTIADSSDSKLAELSMQGLNMGIIEGRKFLNHGLIDERVLNILREYVDVQEEYVEDFKDYL